MSVRVNAPDLARSLPAGMPFWQRPEFLTDELCKINDVYSLSCAHNRLKLRLFDLTSGQYLLSDTEVWDPFEDDPEESAACRHEAATSEQG